MRGDGSSGVILNDSWLFSGEFSISEQKNSFASASIQDVCECSTDSQFLRFCECASRRPGSMSKSSVRHRLEIIRMIGESLFPLD
jgi:hypothetical protein